MSNVILGISAFLSRQRSSLVRDGVVVAAAIAEHYLRQIRHVQAQGPYLLGGFSFGGTVALIEGSEASKVV
jgi:thioesterase domain-containing protein